MADVPKGDLSPCTHHRNGARPRRDWRADDLCPGCWQLPWTPDDPDLFREVVRRLDDGPGFVVLTGLTPPGVREATTGHRPGGGRGGRGGPNSDGMTNGITNGTPDEPAVERLALDALAHLGQPLPQDANKRLTCLVRDEGHVFVDTSRGRVASRTARSSKSREALELHNDAAPRWLGQEIDVLAMLGVREAAEGGDTVLASGRTIYQAVAEADRAAAAVLCEDFTFDRSSEDPALPRSTSAGPVFDPHGERFAVRCNRLRIGTAAWESGQPLSPERARAVDLLGDVLARRDLQVRFRLRPGDCLLLDDAAILHGRTAYRDHAGPGGRCLVRVWLRRHDRQSGAQRAAAVVPELREPLLGDLGAGRVDRDLVLADHC